MWDGGIDAFEMVERARRQFKVSFIVCALKALELGLISEGEFAAAVARHNASAATARPRPAPGATTI